MSTKQSQPNCPWTLPLLTSAITPYFREHWWHVINVKRSTVAFGSKYLHFFSVIQRMMLPSTHYYWWYLNPRHKNNPRRIKWLHVQCDKDYFKIHRQAFIFGTGEMIQQMICLSCKCKGSPKPDKNWTCIVATCNPRTHEIETVYPLGKLVRLAAINGLWVPLEALHQ